MPADIDALLRPIDAPGLYLEQLTPHHGPALRIACAADDAIWTIYPSSYAPEHFDATFAATLANPDRRPFALIADGVLIGMSGYLNLDSGNHVVEIGGTYLAPAVRGTGINRRIKDLLIDRAIAAGFHRIEFRVDIRNARSMAAVAKLGAVREGVLRAQRITWTGHVRDTVVYSILAPEWRPGA